MTPQQFTYWLSGALHTNDEMDASKTQIVKTLFRSVDMQRQEKELAFCQWFQGYMEMDDPNHINAMVAEKIRQKIIATTSPIAPSKKPPPARPPMNDVVMRC